MGKEHPVAWYKTTGAGKTYYTSLGHDATAWQQNRLFSFWKISLTDYSLPSGISFEITLVILLFVPWVFCT